MAKPRRWPIALGLLASFALGAEPLLAQTSSGSVSHAALLPLGSDAWSESARGAIRGITVGPIESALHPQRGYGSEPFERTLLEAKRLGSSWISLTPFARVNDLKSTGISLSFEAPFADNRRAIVRSVRQAHALGLRVLIVPHLWVESGEWRGELNPGSDAAWDEWSRNYRAFLLTWAEVARESQADMLAVGVELRSWLTTAHARSFQPILRDVRRAYPGLLTYAGNWDDIEQTVILGDLDVIGLNAFFPARGKRRGELRRAGGRRARRPRSTGQAGCILAKADLLQ
ncbi:MAG: hypothetical protein WDO69_12800 [Pseudomonadota bacterium]